MNGNVESWKGIRDVKIICENSAKTIEDKVRIALKEGWIFIQR